MKDTGSTFKSNEQSGETGFVYVAEPGGNVEWTVAKWLRLDLSASYRLVSKTRKEGLKDLNLSGPSVFFLFWGVFGPLQPTGPLRRDLEPLQGAGSLPDD